MLDTLLYHLELCADAVLSSHWRHEFDGVYSADGISTIGREALAMFRTNAVWERVLAAGVKSIDDILDLLANIPPWVLEPDIPPPAQESQNLVARIVALIRKR